MNTQIRPSADGLKRAGNCRNEHGKCGDRRRTVRFDIIFYVLMNIPVDDRMREDVSEMCNLSQGVQEWGEAKGEARLILRMYKNGYSIEQIAVATDKTVEEVGTIVEKGEPVLT